MEHHSAPYPEATPEQAEQINAWHQQDPCFGHLNLLRLTCLTKDAGLVEKARTLFDEHFSQCGSCWDNLLIEAERTEDPFKRRTYFNLTMLVQFEFMKFQGGDYQIRQSKGCTFIALKYPHDFESEICGMELLLTPGESHLTLDVEDKALFENPRPLLDLLDRYASDHVKSFDREGGKSIQWWPILGDQQVKLLIRRGGEVKELASDLSLHGRYRRLVQKHTFDDGLVEEKEDGSVGREESVWEEAFALLQLALTYSGQSVFAGFAKSTLEFRLIDRLRKEGRDVAGHTVEPTAKSTASGDDETSDSLTSLEERQGSDQDARDTERGADAALRLRALERLLTERERVVLTLGREPEITDSEIARRIGVTRETVVRDRKTIRGKVKRLKLD